MQSFALSKAPINLRSSDEARASTRAEEHARGERGRIASAGPCSHANWRGSPWSSAHSSSHLLSFGRGCLSDLNFVVLNLFHASSQHFGNIGRRRSISRTVFRSKARSTEFLPGLSRKVERKAGSYCRIIRTGTAGKPACGSGLDRGDGFARLAKTGASLE
jgi:hypothetical protein